MDISSSSSSSCSSLSFSSSSAAPFGRKVKYHRDFLLFAWITNFKILHLHRVHLYSECARLDAVISLDGFLLPLVVGDVPGELEHCAADTGGCAPGRGGRARRVFLPFPPACYIWTRHDPRCPESATVPWNRFSGWARFCLRICGINFLKMLLYYPSFHGTSIWMIFFLFPHFYIYVYIKSCIMHWS